MPRYQHTPEESRIRAALSTMPFGGLEDVSRYALRVGFRDGTPAPIDLDDVAAYLEALAELLGGIASKNADRKQRLEQLEADVAAVRRVFGQKGS